MVSFTAEQRFIVTGASSGIGESVALLLNELGATVIGIGRNCERLDGMRTKCAHPENMFLEIKDLAEDIASIPLYVKTLREKYGKFSGLAYCAGIGDITPTRLLDYSVTLRHYDVNVHAPVFMAKALLDRRNVIIPGASLVFLSSIAAVIALKGQSLYAGSKAALASAIKAMSREAAPMGIRLNSILPSMIKTPMTLSQECGNIGVNEDAQREAYPFGWGSACDLASFVCYLLSDKAKYISGQRYVYDSGGML